MKTALVLSVLLCAAFAEEAMEAPENEVAVASVAENQQEEAPAPESRIFCPDGWFSHGSRCLLFVNSPMSWYNAEEHCNTLGAHLASVTNPREYSFLQQITTTAGQNTAWLGGFNLQGRWLWIDREGFYYSNWYCQYSPSSNPCLYLRTAGGWSNTRCSSTLQFICSKNAFGC